MWTDVTCYPGIRVALLTARPLTDDEATPIKAMMASDQAFKDSEGNWKPAAELLPLLNNRYAKPNPEPQTRVPVSRITPEQWGAFASRMLGKLRAANVALARAGQPPNPNVLTMIDTINEQSHLVQYTNYVEVQGSAVHDPAAPVAGETEASLRAALALYPPCLMALAKPTQFTVYVAEDGRAWGGLCRRFGLPRDRGGWVVDGVTVPARHIVCLRMNSGDGSDLRQVWLHEVYHVLSQTVLTKAERGAWKQVWLREKKERRLVSDYAATSDEEGAAEFISTELLHPAETGPAHPQAMEWWAATVADHTTDGGH